MSIRSLPATAIFDLDGTLTTRDSFLAYLLTFGRRNRRYASLLRTPLRISAYLGKVTPDYRLKQDLIGDFFAQVDPVVIDSHTRWFCENWLPRRLHPVGKSLLEKHRRRGDRVILLSASPDIFVPSVAKALGIDETVCTRIERQGGRVMRRILAGNCKGIKKVEAMQEYLGSPDPPDRSYAYGDSRSDRFVLEWVRYGAWVRRRQMVPLRPEDQAAFAFD